MKAGALENTWVGLLNIAMRHGNGKSLKPRNFATPWPHGNEQLLSEAACDQAGTRLQFIGEVINRVCGGAYLKLQTPPGAV